MDNKNLVQRFASLYTDKSINGWIRGAMFVGTGIVIYSVGHIAYKAIFKTQAEKDAAAAAAALDDSINENKSKGVKATYPLPNYNQFADTIYTSGGYAFSNDYDNILATLKKMQNNLDVELLQKAFGTRPPHTYLGISIGSPMTLFPFLNSTIGNEYHIWSQTSVVNEDWKAKGITYQL